MLLAVVVSAAFEDMRAVLPGLLCIAQLETAWSGMINSPFARASRGSVMTGNSSSSTVISLRACRCRIFTK
jgi:hypothetical protein